MATNGDAGDLAPDRRSGDRRPPAWMERLGRTSWAFIGIAGATSIAIVVVAGLRELLIPFVLAAFLAVVMMPMVDRLQEHRVPRGLGAVLVMLLLVAVVVASAALVVSGVADRSDELGAQFDLAQERLTEITENVDVLRFADTTRDDASGSTGLLTGGIGHTIASTLDSVIGVFAGLILGVVLLYYLLKDGRRLADSTLQRWWIGDDTLARRTVTGAAHRIRSYFKGRTILAAVQGAAVALGLTVMGVPLAASIGIVNFIGAYIPYLGAFVGGGFAVVVAFAEGGPSMAIAALVLVLAVNLVLENLLEPRFIGSSLKMHPIAVLLATVAGGMVAGLVGLVLAAPLAAIGSDLLADLRSSGFFGSRHQRDPEPTEAI